MYIAMKVLSFILCHLSYSGRRQSAQWLGRLFWLLVPQKRKKLAQQQILNCRLTLDPIKAMRIAKASTVRFGTMIVSVLTYPLYKTKGFSTNIVWHGKAYLDEQLKQGTGAIIMASHAGNWEVLGAALAMEGYPLISVAQRQNSQGADKFINEYRRLMRQHVTYKTGIRDMVRLLKSGHYIGLLMDQDPGMAGIPVQFFQQRTLTADGPAKLASIGNYPIYPIFITERAWNQYDITIHPPIFVSAKSTPLSGKAKKDAVYRVTQQLNDILENHIKAHPEDWFWLHNRWKWTRWYDLKQKYKKTE